MTDAHSRKHHSLQIKEKHSKGGSLTGLLLKLFNWNGWLLKKGIPKKLPSAEWSQVSKSGGKDERLHMLPRLATIPDEKDASSVAITRAKDPYYMVQAMPTEDGINLRKPGVVARLMGLDYIPCSPSQNVNGEVHPQGIPTVAPSGKRQHFKSKDVNLTAKVIEKSSKKVIVSKQLQQRQLARSFDINLQKISKTSFLKYASKPLLQKEDIKRMSNPNSVNSVSPHRSRSIQSPSKSVNKLRSTQKNAQSKRATLLLEAAVKTLEPSLRSGDPNRPVLVQALVSRTVPENIGDKRMTLEKTDNGKLCHNHTKGGVPGKGSAIISSIQLASHKKVARSQASGVAPHQETQKQKAPTIEATQNLSDQFQHNKVNVGLMTKGLHGQLQLDTPCNSLEPKPKAEKEVLPTSQLHNRNFHNEVEKATDKTYDRLLRTGHERATMVTVENPTISSKSEIANTNKLSQIQREDHEQTVGVIQLNTEKNLENKPQMTEISLNENLSSCLRNTRAGKDKRSGQTHQEVIIRNQEKNVVREASMVQTVQEKPPARRALAEFSQQRNQNFSNTKRKSLSKTSTEKHSQKSRDLISTADELPATLASCTEQSLSLMENQIEGCQELVIDIGPPPLSTDPKESLKVYEVDERSTQDISNDSSSEGQCVDDNVDLIGSECDNSVSKPCEAVLLGKRKEQSQISKTKIQLCTRDNLCAKHEDRELPNGKEVTGYALKDDNLEDILRSMLSMTVANDSSNEKEHQNDGGNLPKDISKDFIACNNDLENNQPEETRAPSLSLEFKSTPSENTVATPRCAERVFRPDYVEDSGQPSPVSVLELPFEDEDICSWRGEDYSVTVMGELHTRPSSETTDNMKSPSTCKRNLLANSNSSSREIVREAILHNLRKQFLYLFPDEEKENNEMECMQYKATDTSGHEKISVVQHQQLHRFAMAKTWINKEGYSSKTLEASNFYDKLLSDCAKEVLTPKLSFLRYADVWSQPSYVELTALGSQIVDEAYKQITIWSQLNLSTINDLVDGDLSIPAENWTDFQNKIGETGAKLECIIFKGILDELVSDLATSSTRNVFAELGNSIHCDNSLIQKDR